MKTKPFLAAVLAVSAFAAPAAAEQAAAETYRQTFRSGGFYVEYKDDYGKHVLGAKDGERMVRVQYGGAGIGLSFNLFGSLFGGGEKKTPDVMYSGGKYYQEKKTGEGKTIVLVLDENQRADENLNPAEGWHNVQQTLAIPDELAVFYWDDPFRAPSAAVSAPRFSESGKKTVGKKEYDCDIYTSAIRTASGASLGEVRYTLFYEDGSLVRAQRTVWTDGTEYETNTLSIAKILNAVPEDSFKIKANTKVYAAGIGNMDDLLEQPAQVEILAETTETQKTQEAEG